MKPQDGRRRLYAMLVTWLILANSAASGAADRRPLNRSLYIPVAFTLCSHLTKALLYVNQQAVALMPAERIFQFTYYPELKRIEPDVVQIRVEGVRSEGSDPFLARLALTPDGIFTANRKISLDSSKQAEKLRYKIDVHYEKVNLLIQCDTVCARSVEVKTAQAEPEAPTPILPQF